MVERQTENNVKVLRTDNDMEFCSDDFKSFCRPKGIVRHHAIPYTSQQNGVAERMNRTIIYRACCMLFNAGMDRHFWAETTTLKAQLSSEFDMKDLGAARKILGMEIGSDRKSGLLFLSHHNYIQKVLHRFNMHDSNPVSTPIALHFKLSSDQCPAKDEDLKYMSKVPYYSVVGSLIYAMVCSRPDLSYAMSLVSIYMTNPGRTHWEAVKWIFKCLCGTPNACLQFGKIKEGFIGYVDLDYGEDLDKVRSLSGYVFTDGRCAVSWRACLQPIVALSTT
jgi:hypothetical protein